MKSSLVKSVASRPRCLNDAKARHFFSVAQVGRVSRRDVRLRPMAHMKCTAAYDASAFAAFVQTGPRVVLGSTSASRKAVFDELVKDHGLTYEVAAANIDEKSIRFDDPKELVVELGYEKAKALLDRSYEEWKNEETYLITGDQVVVHDGRILEKPESEEELRRNISGFAETPAQTVGSVVCTHVPSRTQMHEIDIATIHMNSLPADIVTQLIAEGNVFNSAGGLLAEHPLVSPYVTSIEGGLDAVMGLSKNTTVKLLLQMSEKIKSLN